MNDEDLELKIQQSVEILDSLPENDKEGLKHGMRELKRYLIRYAHTKDCNVKYVLTLEQYNKLRPYM